MNPNIQKIPDIHKLPAGLDTREDNKLELFALNGHAMALYKGETISFWELPGHIIKTFHREMNMMKKLLTYLSVLFVLSWSCAMADKLEASHYHFYDRTKALIVVKRKRNRVYCRSAAGQQYYVICDVHHRIQSDTIILRDNKWVYAQTRFINKIPD